MSLSSASAVLFVLAIGANGAAGLSFPEPKIVGGTRATLGQFPYQVSLRQKSGSLGNHFCGGSIIDKNHVLTAAHCMVYKPEQFQVWTGGLALNDTTRNLWKSYDVKKFTVHKKYNKDTIDFDIAIVQIAGKFPLNNRTISVIPLHMRNVTEGTTCKVSGWGTTKYGTNENPQKITNDLLFTEVTIPSKTVCRNAYWGDITNNMICAGGPFGGHDACQGDSGGPLACRGSLVGVVSFGKGCGLAPYPGVYTLVSQFDSWINSTISSSMRLAGTHFVLLLVGMVTSYHQGGD